MKRKTHDEKGQRVKKLAVGFLAAILMLMAAGCEKNVQTKPYVRKLAAGDL